MEVSTEWQKWLTNCNSFELDSILSLLLQIKLLGFKEKLSRFIMNVFFYHDILNNLVKSNYHLFILGIFHQTYFRNYKLMSNKEVSKGQFDLKIEPTEKANFKTGVYMEFKILKYDKYGKFQNKEKLQNKTNEALKQIKNKRYFSDFPEFIEQCVICEVACQKKDVYIVGEVLNSW
ncbi:hypothetical protein C1645_739118 [Glomus cerebriforme]|uniref:Uncharacterized protein n=1 Tax=Glomus cerebriforme TaxID=658196 RepID=A0A397SXQ8_9GLOM|nr:hypothetical protein C1645_739118 [Glomus cerebriforme]